MVSITVRQASDGDKSVWDDIVESSPHGTIFHTWEFLRILERQSQNEFIPVIGYDGDNPFAVYPFFKKNLPLVRSFFSPPPNLSVPNMGPAIKNHDQLNQSKREHKHLCFQKAVNELLFESLNADYVRIYTPVGLIDSRPLRWTGYNVTPMHTYELDIDHKLDDIFKGFKKKLRQNIKRHGDSIEVVEGNKKDMEIIFDMLFRRYTEQNIRFKEKNDYLFDLFETLHPDNLRLFIAKEDSEPKVALIDLYYKDKVYSWIGNTKPVQSSKNITDILQWEAIKHAHERGFKKYEEVGGNTERLCQFKSKFNSNLVAYYHADRYGLKGMLAYKTYSSALRPIFNLTSHIIRR